MVQAGLVPALDRDSADVITGSEHIIKAFAAKHSLTATAIVDLIKNVLQNPAFNSYEVNSDMLQRLQASKDSGDLKIILMRVEGNGDKKTRTFQAAC